jgi:hypothetical protein
MRFSNIARYTANFTPSTTPFVNDSNTVLLIHADGTDATTVFRDDNGALANRQPKYITAVGNAQIDTAQSQFGGSSALFDGVNDYLTVSDNNTLSLGTGDYTVECWIRPTSVGSQSRVIFDFNVGANSSNPIFYISASSKLSVYNVPLGGTEGSTNVTTNTWHHVVLSRSSGETKAALNGVWQFSKNNSYTIGNVSFRSIGADTNAGDDFVGHIDEFRVSNIARYNHNANFTAPTAPFVNDANTLLLIHADGVDASTQFFDDTGSRMQKGISAIGNAQVDTAQSKFGGASALFDGTGDYLLIDSTNTADLNFGTGDFTIEFWARNTNRDAFHTVIANNKSSWTAGSVTILGGSGSTNVTALRLAANSFNSGGAGLVHDNQAMTLGVWYHYAIVRSGNNFTMYRDGTSVSTGTFSGSINLGEDGTRVGYTRWDGDVSTWDGHLDEIRISNTARYTAGFTAPTAPFQNDANTVLLLHMDGTDGSTAFFDDNGIAPYTP